LDLTYRATVKKKKPYHNQPIGSTSRVLQYTSNFSKRMTVVQSDPLIKRSLFLFCVIMNFHSYTVSQEVKRPLTGWKVPITSPIFLHIGLDDLVFHDVFQLSLRSRCTSEVRQPSETAQDSRIGHNIHLLTNARVWTKSIIDI
jgi:hypothetical protein